MTIEIFKSLREVELTGKASFIEEKYNEILNKEAVVDNIGDYYFKEHCKKNNISGIVYTPRDIANFMVRNLIKEEDIVGNPYIRICDPACGTGVFIIEIFKHLKKIYMDKLEIINYENELLLSEDDVEGHILKHNLFGYDIDENAIKIAILGLFKISGILSTNISLKDFILEDSEKFDLVLGNPPYIGHKSMDKAYSKKLKEVYKGIYVNKGDLSFCFIQKALKSTNKNGKMMFITSRYFLEAESARGLRKYIFDNASIYRIIDYYGIRPFKRVGIDPAIIEIHKNNNEDYVKIVRPLISNGSVNKEFNDNLIEENKKYNEYAIAKNSIKYNEKWIVIDNIERAIIDNIESKCKYSLGDIGDFNQGIITGCDKAFIVSCKDEISCIESEILKPWIKSTDIMNLKNRREKYLIYSWKIDSIDSYPNVKSRLIKYEEQLRKRRECKKGVRKWYELQWGRKAEIFEKEKIIFPYKASSNRFILNKGFYFSADIYSYNVINEEISMKNVVELLNSNLYEFYIKATTKKLGENMYEYYPNNLRNILIPDIMGKKSTIDEDIIDKYFSIGAREKHIIKKYISI